MFGVEFIKKGYDEITINKTIRMIGDLNRSQILAYKEKSTNNNFDIFKNLLFQLPFNCNYLNIEKFFKDFKISTNINPSLLSQLNLNLIYKMNLNNSQIFIHNAKIFKPLSYKFFKCNKISCKFCDYSGQV